MSSYWVETTKQTNYPRLSQNITTDVLIIGGGITGILTAYMLSESGLNVSIVEADRIAMGVTANTTAKITSQHGLLYDYLLNSYNFDIAKGYLDSNEEAIKTIANIVNKENINCDFSYQDSYVYTCNKDNVTKIVDEVSAVTSLGLKAQYVTDCPLPFSIEAGIKFPKQAQFHPRKYLLSLLPILEKRDVNIYENSKVENIKHIKNKYEVYTNSNKIIAKHLVMASHYPIKNFPGMYFIKMYQNSSYAIGVEIEKEVFDGMYISCDTPTTSFRNIVQDNGKKLLIVGGSGHKTGDTNVDIESSYINLANYIKSIYPKANVKYKWMTEDCVTLDKIPYIGEFSSFLPNMYVATGYKKWGMTSSHVAAKIISDKILAKHNSYENIYTATRLKPIKNSKEFGNMLKQSTYSLAINKMSAPIISYDKLDNDSGGVVDYKGEKLGIYKDKSGKLFAVIPYCKHLGCELSWNNLEKTWDCPCHGSRYDYMGKIITEPTTESLDIVDISDI
ncbi:MAG: FAD-dependent oxidoreductase [Clostridia bacterium]|nr:FAD-dependent oxidoreductase [Clostridia bacterium]